MVWCKISFILVFARLRELENQLVKLEASNPSAPPALKFKVKFYGLLYFVIIVRSSHILIMTMNVFTQLFFKGGGVLQ